MGKNLVLFDKIYITSKQKKREDIFLRYLKYLRERVKGFPDTSLTIKKLRDFDKRFEITISGSEEVFVYNLLKKEIGSIKDFKEVREGQIYKGTLIDVGKVGFGLFVDCAILNPQVDVLINLHTLRDQLCKGREKSLPEIIEAYDFIDHFPIEVKIRKIDKENNKLQGEITQNSLNLFRKIMNENLEGIFLSGETKGQFKKVIVKKGHFRDIITIKRIGFLENLLLLKPDSNAPGIIANIGRELENCRFSVLHPKRMRKMYN
ncbi:MAG: DUF2110 family protein [Candidatus Hermodarchaeota archaeon]